MSIDVRRQLLKALQLGCLVELHRDPEDWSRCQVGYVDAVGNESVRIRSVTPRGDVLGYEVYDLAVVVGVVTDNGDNDYLDKIARLVGKRGEVFRDVESWESGDIRGALCQAMRRQCIVTVGRTYKDEESVCGLVRAMTDDSVSIQVVDQYGEDDSLATVPIKGITAVHLGTEDEQLLDYLRASYTGRTAMEREKDGDESLFPHAPDPTRQPIDPGPPRFIDRVQDARGQPGRDEAVER